MYFIVFYSRTPPLYFAILGLRGQSVHCSAYSHHAAANSSRAMSCANDLGVVVVDGRGEPATQLPAQTACPLSCGDCGAQASVGYLAVLFICVFVVNFAYSWGPICWIYPSEIFPMHVKSKAVSIATCGNWVTNMVFGKFTPTLIGLIGPSFAYSLPLFLLILQGNTLSSF